MTHKKKAVEAEPDGPLLADAAKPVDAGAPVVDRTAVSIVDGQAFVRVDRPDEPLSGDELHNLRRQCEAAFIEVS